MTADSKPKCRWCGTRTLEAGFTRAVDLPNGQIMQIPSLCGCGQYEPQRSDDEQGK